MIKNFIFDFGDVFINLDKSATVKELQKLGLTAFTPVMQQTNKLYEKGLLSTDAFLDFYKKQFPNASKTELITAWNKIILDFPAYRLEFIEAFSKKNRCFLLSNINDLHLTLIKEQLGKEFYNRFIDCFEKVYYTHEIHLRKPDATIFEFVFEDANIKPKTCFFVDDTPENTKMATQLGMQCWTIIPKKEDVINISKILINRV